MVLLSWHMVIGHAQRPWLIRMAYAEQHCTMQEAKACMLQMVPGMRQQADVEMKHAFMLGFVTVSCAAEGT